MKSAKPNGSTEISQSLDAEIGKNFRELTRTGDVLRQAEIAGDEIAANSLGPFLQRVAEASRREIEYLIRDLQTLDKKLHADVSRIQHDIEECVALSQGVMQLTSIISDSVRKLPGAPGIVP
jgi:hypothetical protein